MFVQVGFGVVRCPLSVAVSVKSDSHVWLVVSNVFVTDIFTPNSILINLLHGASRVVNPLPTYTDEFPSSHMIAQRPRLGKWTPSFQRLAGRHSYCFCEIRLPM